jgi:uncharacterized protein YjbJ (UPF0337 family)
LATAISKPKGSVEKTEGHIRSDVGKAMDAIREVLEKE